MADTYFHRGEVDRFLVQAERAIALNPNDAFTLALLGERLQYVGDERGIVLVRKAIKLDPFHPTWFYFPIAYHHFQRGEYEEALAAARQIDVPGLSWPPIFMAGIYAELGRQREAQAAVKELLSLYPDFTTETLIEEWGKWNRPEEATQLWVAALRKAGLPD